MKEKRLTNKEIADLAYSIGKPVFKYLNKKIEREISRIGNPPIHINDFINVTLITLANIATNKFTFLKQYFDQKTGLQMDYSKLIHSYMVNLTAMLDEEEKKKLKEKLK